ncbi:hypothetical protein [Paenibacillus sp. SI8]|uniref:hypothetical protein n=1 Tax=unclassified Paenibacillus TaxID=185978 RepID=UPI003465739F
MLRYWKLIVIVPLIMLVFGTYYLTASDDIPPYYIKTIAGDEKEAAHVSLQAYDNNQLQIQTGGSRYVGGNSFLESLESDNYLTPELERLIKENRSFMRGKRNLAGIYEDAHILGYAEIDTPNDYYENQSGKVTISLYDKERRTDRSFQVMLPRERVTDIIVVSNVQIKESLIKLVTSNQSDRTVRATRSQHVYSIDLVKQTVIGDQTILNTAVTDKNQHIDIMDVYEADHSLPSNFIVRRIAHTRQQDEKDRTGDNTPSQEPVIEKSELFVYDLWNDKASTLTNEAINRLSNEPASLALSLEGDMLYLTSWADPKGPRTLHYNLRDSKVVGETALNIAELQANATEAANSRIVNGRFFTLLNALHDGNESYPKPPILVVAELGTGRILYQGLVARKDNQPFDNLNIHSLFFYK